MKIAFPTDEHVPFHDRAAINVAQQIVQAFKPDILVRGSDGLDMFSVSSFVKRAQDAAEFNLQREIDLWHENERAWHSAVPKETKKRFLIGNHEERLERYLSSRAPELDWLDAFRLPNVLNFDRYDDMRLAKNNEIIIDGQLMVSHGWKVNKHSAYTAKNSLADLGNAISLMLGHTHRMGSFYITLRGGRVSQAHECGCLCDTNPAYMSNANWQQGLSLATVKNFGVTVESIPFYKKSGKTLAQWRGKEYKSD